MLIGEDCAYHMSASALSHLMDLEDLYVSRSADIGVFICVKCSGVHRSLRTHVSTVLSVTLDQWADDEINSMIELGGNSYVNATCEALLSEGYQKPHPDFSQEERVDFIRSQYELQEFLNSSLSETGMVEFVGILKFKVIRGTTLAVRDLMSSDPKLC